MCDSFDGSVLGLQRGNAQLVRNAIASGSKLALVPLLVITDHRTGVALLCTWVVGLLISLPTSYGMLKLSLGNPLAVPTASRSVWLAARSRARFAITRLTWPSRRPGSCCRWLSP